MGREIDIDLTPSLEQTPSYTFLLNLNGQTHLVSGFGPPSLNVTEQCSLASSTVLYNTNNTNESIIRIILIIITLSFSISWVIVIFVPLILVFCHIRHDSSPNDLLLVYAGHVCLFPLNTRTRHLDPMTIIQKFIRMFCDIRL